ncbi:MAG: FtsL-like putative cell division protein [Muribaculaceae bacterium]
MAKTDNTEPKAAPKQQQVADRSERIFIRILKGKIVPYHFFKRHWMIITVVVSMILMSIANKYECQTKITEIKHLEKELQIAQANRVEASAQYNSMIRESSMMQMVETMQIDLISPECPPYNLSEYEAK